MNRRIRILFFIDSLNNRGGTENQLIEIIRRLHRGRFEVFAACLEDGEPLRELDATIHIFPIGGVFSFRALGQLWLIRRMIKRNRIDVVHTLMFKSTLLGVLGARWAGCKSIVTSRRNLGDWYTPFYLRVVRLLNRQTTRVLANSEAAKRSAIALEEISAARVDVLYNGVDVFRFEGPGDPALLDMLGIPRDARIVGIVANYRPAKDLPLFLRAARLIAARHPSAVFLLVGRGPLREELGRVAREEGIGEKIFFSDGKGDVSDYLPLMQVACLSSATESFSNAILEYMAAGLPTVATDVGGNAEAIEHEVTGYLVPAGNAELMASSVLELLENHELRKAMGARASDRCRQRFAIDTCVQLHESYYERLLTDGRERKSLSD
jgi:L-malate glycosyltransferase